MEEQLAHKMEDLKIEELNELNQVEKEQLPPDAPTVALNPRFNYMESQLAQKTEDLQVEELKQIDSTEDTSYETIDSTIGIIPGMNGFVRKTKKLTREERQRLLGEMDEKYGAVVDDMREESGAMLIEERRKL